MKKLLITVFAVLALVLMVSGCTATGGPDDPMIDSLMADVIDTGQGYDVQIDLEVANFEVVDSLEGGTGDGYYVYYMDTVPSGGMESIIPGPPATTVTPTETTTTTTTETENMTTSPMETETTTTATSSDVVTGFASLSPSYTFEDVSPGYHVFAAQLVDAEGIPPTPPVVIAVLISVPSSEGNGSQTTTATSPGTTNATMNQP